MALCLLHPTCVLATTAETLAPESHAVRLTRAFERAWDDVQAHDVAHRAVLATPATSAEYAAYASAHTFRLQGGDSVAWRIRSATIAYREGPPDTLIRTAAIRLANDRDTLELAGAVVDTLAMSDAETFDRSVPLGCSILPVAKSPSSAPLWVTGIVAAITLLLGTLLAGRL